MKKVFTYKLPCIDKNFSSANKVFAYLQEESLKIHNEVKTSIPLLQLNSQRPGRYRNFFSIKQTNDFLETAIQVEDERGYKYFKDRKGRTRTVNALIAKKMYFEIFDNNFYQDLNLTEEEYIVKQSHYKVLYEMALKVVELYSPYDVEDVTLPVIPMIKEADNKTTNTIFPPRYQRIHPTNYMG